MTKSSKDELEEKIEKDIKDYDFVKRQIGTLAEILEKMRLADYVTYLNKPGRLLLVNFSVGLVRGLGVALGASILAGIVIMILRWIGVLNLPIIGGFIADLVKIVNLHIGK